MTPIWVAGRAGVVAHAIDAEATVVDGWAQTACRPRGRVRLDAGNVDELTHCVNCVNALARTCGTYAGYQHHKKIGEKPCQPCLDANAEYTREWRARSPEIRAKGNRETAARSRALWRLAREHPKRFKKLFAEEMAR